MFTVLFINGESAPKIKVFESKSDAKSYINTILDNHENWYSTKSENDIEWIWDEREWIYYFPDDPYSQEGYYAYPEKYICMRLSW